MESYIVGLAQNVYVLLTVIVWSGIWNGLALWRAARLKQVGWFVAILVLNTLGILEIIYLIVTRKKYSEAVKAEHIS